MIKAVSPHQIVIIPIEDINKDITLETYQNYDELVNITATVAGENADTAADLAQTYLKMNLGNHPYFGDEGLPVKAFEPNTQMKILERGYVFADFYPDTPVAKAVGSKMVFHVVSPIETESFKNIILTISYKGKNDN